MFSNFFRSCRSVLRFSTIRQFALALLHYHVFRLELETVSCTTIFSSISTQGLCYGLLWRIVIINQWNPISQTLDFANFPIVLYPAEFVFLPSAEHCNFTSDFSDYLIFLLPSIFEASVFVVVDPFRVIPWTEGLRKKKRTGTRQIFCSSFVSLGIRNIGIFPVLLWLRCYSFSNVPQ